MKKPKDLTNINKHSIISLLLLKLIVLRNKKEKILLDHNSCLPYDFYSNINNSETIGIYKDI